MAQQSSSVIGSFSKAGSQSPSEPPSHVILTAAAAGDKVFAYYVHISFLPWTMMMMVEY